MSDDISKISRIQLIFGVCAGSFNDHHKKFGLNFIEEDMKRLIPEIVDHRINLVNPFDTPEVSFAYEIARCPRRNDQEWTRFQYQDLGEYREFFPVSLNQLERGNINALFNFVCGKYRLDRALNIITLIRRYDNYFQHNLCIVSVNFMQHPFLSEEQKLIFFAYSKTQDLIETFFMK